MLAGALPWGLVLTGAGIARSAMLCGVSGLAFAIGVYLPLATMAPIFVGGCVRALVDEAARAQPEQGSDPGVLAASGPRRRRRPGGRAGRRAASAPVRGAKSEATAPRRDCRESFATLLLVAAVCLFLVRAGRSARRQPSAAPGG